MPEEVLRAAEPHTAMRFTFALLCLAIASRSLAAPGDYNATRHYGVHNSSLSSMLFEPQITAATLLSETTEMDGRKRLSFHFTLNNISGGYFEEPAVFLNSTEGLPWTVESVTPAAEAAELPPGTSVAPAVVTTTSPLTFIVAAADAEAAKTAILALQHIHLSAWDLYRFNVPIHAADAAMDTAFVSGSQTGSAVTMQFSASTPSLTALTTGALLVHNPEVFELRGPAFTGEIVLKHFLTDVETAAETMKSSGVATKLIQIGSVTTDASTGVVTVTGMQVNAQDQMISIYCKATQMDGFIGAPVRDPYNPPVGTSFHTDAEYMKRIAALNNAKTTSGSSDYPPAVAADLAGLFTLHYPLNDVEIVPGVTLDGEVLFKGLNFRFEGAERDDQRNKWAYRLTNRLDVTLRLTAEAGMQLIDMEKTIISVPLPTVVIPMFQVPITIQPLLSVKVGAAVSIGSRIQVPIHCAVDAGFEMAYDGSKPPGTQFTFKPFAEPVPMQMSKPSLARAIHMNAKAWAEVGLDLLLQNTLGPGIAVRATGDLRVRPLDNPWWNLDGDLELRGRFAFNLFGIPLLTANAPPHHLADLFHRNAGGAHTPSGLNGPLDNEEGAHVRWARAARWTSSTIYGARACRVRGTAEDVFVVLNSSYPNSTLMRVSAKGELLWMRSVNEPLQHVIGTLDGGVILGGCANGAAGIRLIKYDGNGNRLWEKQHLLAHSDTATPQLYVAKMLSRDTSATTQELHVVGWRYRNLNSRHTDPFLYRLDGDGNVLGIKSYDSPDYIAVHDATYTADGGLVWCGMCQPSPDGVAYPGPGVTNYGWLMRTDLLGAMQWSTLTPSMRGNSFNSVTSAPDGTIFTSGYLMTVVDPQYGSAQLTKHNSFGLMQAAVTLCESTDSSTVDDYAMRPSTTGIPVNVDTNPSGPTGTGFENWLPDSGKTVWDEGRRILWTPNGLILASTSGLSSSRAATIACLTEDFSVRWFTGHERGSSEEYIFDVIPTDDGYFAVGSSAQFLDFKTKSSAPFTNDCAIFLKLPLEGKCDLHPGTKGIHRFLQPGVHDHQNNELELGPYQPNIMPSIGASCTVVDATSTLGGTLFPHQFVELPLTHWVPLERGDANQSMTYAQWAAYWNLASGSAGADADGDGRTNGQEWFFGGDPSVIDPGPPQLDISRDGSTLSFTFTKSHAARLQLPRIESSTNLSNWTEVVLPTLTVTPLDPYTDEVSFSLPLTSDTRRFFRTLAP